MNEDAGQTTVQDFAETAQESTEQQEATETVAPEQGQATKSTAGETGNAAQQSQVEPVPEVTSEALNSEQGEIPAAEKESSGEVKTPRQSP